MPASNTWELYNIDDTILSCSAAACRNVGISAVYQERDIQQLSTPAVTLTVQQGSPFHMYWLENTGSVWDSWNYTMEANIYTERYNNNISQSIYNSKVIDTLADHRTYDGLSYYFVENMQVNGISKGRDEDNNLDVTQIRITFDVWIRPDAWPA